MLFNPQAERLTFNRLRDIAVTFKPQLKGQLDECLRGKALEQDAYLQCQKTESEQRAFDGAIKLWDERIGLINQAAYRAVREELLITEGVYGFGTPLPVTPQSSIEVIPPNYWLFLEVYPEKAEARGHGLHYVGIFFQRERDVPPETIALVKERQSNQSIATPDASPPPVQQTHNNSDFYIAPYLQLMLDAAKQFGAEISSPRLKKDTIMDWFKAKAVEKGFTLSERAVEVMATAIRPLESQKGGIKSSAEIAKQGDTVKQPEDA